MAGTYDMQGTDGWDSVRRACGGLGNLVKNQIVCTRLSSKIGGDTCTHAVLIHMPEAPVFLTRRVVHRRRPGRHSDTNKCDSVQNIPGNISS